MKQITKTEFLEGLESGHIFDWGQVGNRVYGKDPRGCVGTGKKYEIVWCYV